MDKITIEVTRPFYIGTNVQLAGARVEVPQSFGLEMINMNKARIVGDLPPAQPLASSDAASDAIAADRKAKRA
jgi:hypothetical protein